MSHFYPVILRVGSRTVEAGFAGDSYALVRTWAAQDGDFWRAESSHSGSEELAIERALEQLVFALYQEALLVDAKKCKVLVLEPVFFPVRWKRVMTKVLLFHLHAQSVRFVPEPLACCVGSGSKSGIVVDCGWNYVSVTPVYDLRLIYRLGQSSVRSGRLLHELLRDRLEAHLGVSPAFEQVERIISEVCYVDDSSASTEYTDDELFRFEELQFPNHWRHSLLEQVYFTAEPGYVEDDHNKLIVPMITQLIPKLDIDLRTELASRIIITGGMSRVPGFKARVMRLLNNEIHAQCIKTLGPFEGASLYCSTSIMTSRDAKKGELPRDKYLKSTGGTGTSASQLNAHLVPDWVDDLYSLSRVKARDAD